MGVDSDSESNASKNPSRSSTGIASPATDRPNMARGFSVNEDPNNNVFAPPKTTVFESAGDILNPPIPPREFITNPESRPRTIFHDRVYHPDDIPPPPLKKKRSGGLSGSFASDSTTKSSLKRSNTDYGPAGPIPNPNISNNSNNGATPDTSSMKVEEKIARAYHHDLSWRKVLVRLEPDAHNNICVRRMFANAYGWPVVKHLTDTHFADTYAAATADVAEPSQERAKPMREAVGEHGEEVELDPEPSPEPATGAIGVGDEKKGGEWHRRTESETQEAKDEVVELKSLKEGSLSSQTTMGRSRKPPPMGLERQDSAVWDDAMFDVTDDDDDEDGNSNPDPKQNSQQFKSPPRLKVPGNGTTDAEIAEFLTQSPAQASAGEGEGGVGLHLEQRTDAPVSGEQKNETPEILHGYSTTVGLGKSMEEQMDMLAKAASGGGRDRDPGNGEAAQKSKDVER
ncbi:MAG: hypothetical protein Q9174_007064 [Haloplaca sp. 1 TL-2023]